MSATFFLRRDKRNSELGVKYETRKGCGVLWHDVIALQLAMQRSFLFRQSHGCMAMVSKIHGGLKIAAAKHNRRSTYFLCGTYIKS